MAQDINVTIQDSIVNIKDSNGNTIKTDNVLAEGTKDIIIGDSQINIKRTDDTNIMSDYVSVDSEKTIIIDDSNISINGVDISTVMANSNEDIVVKNQHGSQVGSKSGNEWIVDTNAAGESILNVNGEFITEIESYDTFDLNVKNTTGEQVGSLIGDEWIVDMTPVPSALINTKIIDSPNYTLILEDSSKNINMVFTDISYISIPTNDSVPFPINTVIEGFSSNGYLTIDGDVTIESIGNKRSLDIGSRFRLIKTDINTWNITGDLVTLSDRIVVMGDDSTFKPMVMYTDAKTNNSWSAGSVPHTTGVIYTTSLNYYNKRFYAVSPTMAGTSQHASVSVDGYSWTSSYITGHNTLSYGNGRMLLTPLTGSYSSLMFENFSASVSNISTASMPIISSIYVNGKFINIYRYGTYIMIYSSITGQSFTNIAMFTHNYPSTSTITGIVYGNGTYIIYNNSYNIIHTSTDGVTWTQRTTPFESTKIIYGNGIFGACKNGYASTSTDGITWTDSISTGILGIIMDIIYVNGFFVVVSNNTNNGRIAFSTNFIDWNVRNAGSSLGFRSIYSVAARSILA